MGQCFSVSGKAKCSTEEDASVKGSLNGPSSPTPFSSTLEPSRKKAKNTVFPLPLSASETSSSTVNVSACSRMNGQANQVTTTTSNVVTRTFTTSGTNSKGGLSAFMRDVSALNKGDERQRGGDAIEKFDVVVSPSLNIVSKSNSPLHQKLVVGSRMVEAKEAGKIKPCSTFTTRTIIEPKTNVSTQKTVTKVLNSGRSVSPVAVKTVTKTKVISSGDPKSPKSPTGLKTLTKSPNQSQQKNAVKPSTLTNNRKTSPEDTSKKVFATSKTITIAPQAPKLANKTDLTPAQKKNKEVTVKTNGFHFLPNKESVREKTIDIQTRKVFKDGKWMEETTRTEIISSERGTVTKNKKTTHRDLPPNEIPHPQSPLKDKNLPSPEARPANPAASRVTTTLPALKKTQQVTKQAQQQKPLVKDNPESFARQVLVSTNSYRRIHGAPPLQLNDRLNVMAKEWAEKLAKMEKMEHGDKKNIGENIYCKTSSQPWFEMRGDEVTENWYNEVDEHNYDEEPTQGYLKTGHFTQLVWKDTKEMGVAFARNKNGHMAFVVAYFSPKGNWIGEFKSQVLPPGGVQKTTKNNIKTKSKKSDQEGSKAKSQINSQEKITTGESRTSSRNTVVTSTPRNTAGSPITPSTGKTSATYTPRASTAVSGGQTSRGSSVGSPGSSFGVRNLTPRWTPSPSESETYKPFSSSSRSSSRVTSPSLSTMADENFLEDFLKSHNYYRSRHGVQPLRYNNKLSKFAQEWADRIAKLDRMQHRMDNDYGENIYMKWSPDPKYTIPGEEAVDSWYEEINEYEFGKEPVDLSAGHFTQVIWSDSEELGVGVAKSSSNKIYVVANYDPPGNYVGLFSKKVPPPL